MTENVILGLSVLSSWRYVFISQKAYQESETRPESSVYMLMKGTAVHGDDILDTVEYAQPSEVSPEQMLQYQNVTSTLSASFCLYSRGTPTDWAFYFFLTGWGCNLYNIKERIYIWSEARNLCWGEMSLKSFSVVWV